VPITTIVDLTSGMALVGLIDLETKSIPVALGRVRSHTLVTGLDHQRARTVHLAKLGLRVRGMGDPKISSSTMKQEPAGPSTRTAPCRRATCTRRFWNRAVLFLCSICWISGYQKSPHSVRTEAGLDLDLKDRRLMPATISSSWVDCTRRTRRKRVVGVSEPSLPRDAELLGCSRDESLSNWRKFA
jgi:hypothetical protein